MSFTELLIANLIIMGICSLIAYAIIPHDKKKNKKNHMA